MSQHMGLKDNFVIEMVLTLYVVSGQACTTKHLSHLAGPSLMLF